MRRGGRAPQSAASSSAPSLASLGAHVLYRWKAESSGVTRDGGNLVSAVANIDAAGVAVGSGNMVQATGSNQPIYRSTGFGPNSVSWVELQDATDSLTASISIAAGNRAGIYIVGKVGNTNGFYTWRVTHAAGGESRMVNNATQYVLRVQFTGGQASLTVTSPAKDVAGGAHLFAIRPLASGALLQIDGATTTPDLSGTDTLTEITEMRWGTGGSGDTGSGFREIVIVDDSSDEFDTIIKDYVAYDAGITLA